MSEHGRVIAWAGVALVIGAAALRRRASPVQRPLLPSMVVAATLAAAAALGGLGLRWQLTTAAVTIAGVTVLAWRWRMLLDDNRLPSGVGGRRMVGATAIVTVAITASTPGQVHLLGDDWPAATQDASALPVGSRAMVTRVEGIHLHVTAAPEVAPDRSQRTVPEQTLETGDR